MSQRQKQAETERNKRRLEQDRKRITDQRVRKAQQNRSSNPRWSDNRRQQQQQRPRDRRD